MVSLCRAYLALWMKEGSTSYRVSVVRQNKMNMKIMGKTYRTVVRPALMYGEETWASKKAQKNNLGCRIHANATMDVRSYEGGQDKKWKNNGDNESGGTAKKVQEGRLKWYGHVM